MEIIFVKECSNFACSTINSWLASVLHAMQSHVYVAEKEDAEADERKKAEKCWIYHNRHSSISSFVNSFQKDGKNSRR